MLGLSPADTITRQAVSTLWPTSGELLDSRVFLDENKSESRATYPIEKRRAPYAHQERRELYRDFESTRWVRSSTYRRNSERR